MVLTRQNPTSLWIQSMAGGAPFLLKQFDGGGSAGAVWSPDGRHMAAWHRTTTTDLALITGFGPAAAK